MDVLRNVFLTCSLACLVFVSSAQHSNAAEYEGVTVSLIKKTTTTTDSSRIEYLKTDKAEVTVLTVELPPGAETGWHYHPVPVYAYMLSGSITIETENGKKYEFNEGDAIVEIVNTVHNGRNLGKIPAKLVVFYTGERDEPTTIKSPRK